jgi:hypothetical protein
MRASLWVMVCGCSRFALDDRAPVAPSGAFFTDVSASSGIQVGNYDPDPPAGMAINDHSRLAFADLDGDGVDDAVMHSLFPNVSGGVPFEHLVFRGRGDGTFEDVTDASGLRDVVAAFFAFADFDGDGDTDLYAGVDLDEAGPSNVWLNDGSGHFTPVQGAGVPETGAAGTVIADFDGDAILDLFVAHGSSLYIMPDRLYRGVGDGTFEEVSQRLAGRPSQPSNGAVGCDYDDDGDVDIVVSTYGVSTEGGLNHLWENDGAGNFTEVGVERGMASLATGNPWLASTGNGADPEPDAGPGEWIGSNGFGVDCGDVDGDGHLDLVFATISHPVNSDYTRKWSDPTHVLLNQGPDAGYSFVDARAPMGIPFNEGDIDAALVDFDLDGRLDLSLTRVSVYESAYEDYEQKSWFGLLHQHPDGTYASLGATSGINGDGADPFLRAKGGQNHAWSDVDRDGDLDLLVGGRDQGGGRPNFLLRNDVGHQNRSATFRLRGDGEHVNTDAIGARLTLRDAESGVVRVREVKGGRGTYNSEDTRVVHLGLDGVGRGATLEIRWPDGSAHTLVAGRDFGDGSRVTVRWPDDVLVEE